MSEHIKNPIHESVETTENFSMEQNRATETSEPAGAPEAVAAIPAALVEKTTASKPPKPRKPPPRKPEPVLCYTTEQRLKIGSFSIDEAAAFCGWSREKIYADAKRGLVKLTKVGGRTIILGPELVRYRAGKAG
jgi:hypothetical protein